VFTVPRWVGQVLDIARPMADILAAMNQNIRRNLLRMQKQGFGYVFTQDREDFDLFYRKMYCPYIQTANGTFNFKRQWGTRVAPERDVHTEWIFCAEELSPDLRRRLNDQGFISRVGDLHCRVFLLGAEEELDAARVHERECASRYGLDGVLFISPPACGERLRQAHQLLSIP